MLDVHPPEHAAHSWRDFFIHIATIVIGLLIAIGLEQTVEFVHHREQRARLLEDLRLEAEGRIRTIANNNRVHSADQRWYRDTLHALLAAQPVAESVTFVIPAQPRSGEDPKPEIAVWDAAKASGVVSVLSRDEIEAWNRVNFFAELTQRRVEQWNADSRHLAATEDSLGISLVPGKSVRLAVKDRDDLARALGSVIEDSNAVIEGDVATSGSSEAVLHGARNAMEMVPYIRATQDALPR